MEKGSEFGDLFWAGLGSVNGFESEANTIRVVRGGFQEATREGLRAFCDERRVHEKKGLVGRDGWEAACNRHIGVSGIEQGEERMPTIAL